MTARSDIVRQRFPRLAEILDVLSKSSGVRSELVAEIKEQIKNGEYLTEDKLNQAICLMLKDLLD